LGGNATWEGRGESGEPDADGIAVETDSAETELLSLPAGLVAVAECDAETLAELDADRDADRDADLETDEDWAA
jgi:hypothetical protein